MEQKLLQEAAMLEQYTRQLEEHDALLTQQLNELEQFREHLGIFSKEQPKRILASLGKGVYVRSDIAEQTLFVEVGAGVIVRKSASDVADIVTQQLEKLKSSQLKLTAQIGLCQQRLQELMSELDKQHAHEH